MKTYVWALIEEIARKLLDRAYGLRNRLLWGWFGIPMWDGSVAGARRF